MVSGQFDLEAFLELPAEVIGVDEVDTAVHESKAVSRGDNGVCHWSFEDISFGNFYIFDVIEVAFPGGDHIGVDVSEIEFHDFP